MIFNEWKYITNGYWYKIMANPPNINSPSFDFTVKQSYYSKEQYKYPNRYFVQIIGNKDIEKLFNEHAKISHSSIENAKNEVDKFIKLMCFA